MDESQASILEKAKRGEPQAIATLLNRNLQAKGITAKTSVKNGCFWIMLEAAKTPPQKQLVEFIRQAFTKLEVNTYATVKIYGKCLNEEIPDWHEDFTIAPKVSLSLEQMAKQGEVQAITTLIKQWLNGSDVTAKVSKKDDCLLIMLASVEVPDQQQMSTKIQTELWKLEIESVTKLKIYGKQIGQEFPDWHIETEINKVEEVVVENNNTLFYEEAIASYDRALQINPTDSESWNFRGVALRCLGRNEEAIASYDRALEINPDDSHVWFSRGILLSDDLGRYEEAIVSYDNALKVESENDELWKSRSVALRKLGRYEEALTSCEKALQINPENPRIYYSKALTYSLKNDLELALETLQQIIQIDPEGCPEVMKTHPDFDNIRSDPRFQELIQ